MSETGTAAREACPECGAPGPQRHLSVVSGCQTCMEANHYPVHTPKRFEPKGWRVRLESLSPGTETRERVEP